MLGALDPSKRYVIPGAVGLENAGMSKPFLSAARSDCLVPEVNRSTVDSDQVRAPRWQSEALWMALRRFLKQRSAGVGFKGESEINTDKRARVV